MRKIKKKENRGRKPLNPAKKKVPVTFYTEKCNVDEFGGLKKARESARQMFETASSAKAFNRISNAPI